MNRVVVDANVIISALIANKPCLPLLIYEDLIKQKFINVTSVEILEELEEVANRRDIISLHKLSSSDVNKIINNIAELSVVVSATKIIEVIKEDPDDDKFLACAVESKASYIVSGDNHLLKLKKYEGIKIVNPREFKEILEKQIA